MPRDYKHRAGGRRRSKQPAGWVWLLAGLAVGLFVAFLVYLQMRNPAPPQPVPLARPAERDTRDVRRKKTEPIPAPPPRRFSFYDTLPEMEVLIPEQEITGKPHEGVRQVERPGTYLLQAGSFRQRSQAEQLRARLGLLGLTSAIQTVTVDGSKTWHRVRVGPFHDLRELNKARALLKRNGIDAILMAVKNP
ncbi:MAG TPA: SPOR domain-containing protein [Gammaproteobacteria bacterium]|nr:SPOR domain-containing protein [Gammaproteobacteria bacterium]